MFNLSKSKILAHRQCPKRLWKLFGGPQSLDLTIYFLNPTVAWNISFI